MKKVILLLLFIFIGFQSSKAQVFPFFDQYESYTAFNVPPGYTGDVTVYLTHGTSSSKALAAYLTSFSTSDSIIFPAIGPLSMFSVLGFDWRMMDPFLYPSTAATLAPGDSFNIYISTDSITWTQILTINSTNFPGATTFENRLVPLSSYAGETILLKVKGIRANGSAEFFIDIDNVWVDVPGAISRVNELTDFSVYPTPTFQYLNIANSVPITGDLKIVDVMGKIVYEKNLQNCVSDRLDLSHLLAGNYQLIVKTGTGNKICPIVIR